MGSRKNLMNGENGLERRRRGELERARMEELLVMIPDEHRTAAHTQRGSGARTRRAKSMQEAADWLATVCPFIQSMNS